MQLLNNEYNFYFKIKRNAFVVFAALFWQRVHHRSFSNLAPALLYGNLFLSDR